MMYDTPIQFFLFIKTGEKLIFHIFGQPILVL